jgi:hypothetical protein
MAVYPPLAPLLEDLIGHYKGKTIMLFGLLESEKIDLINF